MNRRNRGAPSSKAIAEQNEYLLRRQQQFSLAVEYVARSYSQVDAVERVVLFGSVAVPLRKEVPRFAEFRRAGIEVWHECKDADLAVWVTDLDCLPRLQKLKARALSALLEEKRVGVAHHQVDVFLMEPGTDRYLGRLCWFNVCPKGKPECLVPGCGASPFLRQHEDFELRAEALRPDAVVVLFDRSGTPRRPAALAE